MRRPKAVPFGFCPGCPLQRHSRLLTLCQRTLMDCECECLPRPTIRKRAPLAHTTKLHDSSATPQGDAPMTARTMPAGPRSQVRAIHRICIFKQQEPHSTADHTLNARLLCRVRRRPGRRHPVELAALATAVPKHPPRHPVAVTAFQLSGARPVPHQAPSYPGGSRPGNDQAGWPRCRACPGATSHHVPHHFSPQKRMDEWDQCGIRNRLDLKPVS